MTKHADKESVDAPIPPSRRAGLHGLLFTGTALGTTLLMVPGGDAVKLPPFKGE
jgi:hypothetical protein